MDVLKTLRNAADTLADLPRAATQALGDAVQERTARIAVTGLSRAGKTVFITSMLQNLLAMGRGFDTLPALRAHLAARGARIRRVTLLPAGASVHPQFDFAGKLHELGADTPSWPPPTEEVAEIGLMLELEPPPGLPRPWATRRLRLDILDYPGEWLLDLPLLQQDFAIWSAQTLARLRTPPRDLHAGAFLAFVAGLRGQDVPEEAHVRQGHDLYRTALLACRGQAGLRYLQPGRFLAPGPGMQAPFMWFFPLAIGPRRPAPGSLAALLTQRFETYKTEVARRFLATHLRGFDRQVILVDVLGALAAGQAAFEDTTQALHDIGITLAGRNRLRRVVLAATKADYVNEVKRQHLRGLLRDMVRAPASIAVETVAAALATQDGEAFPDGPTGRAIPIVRGHISNGDRLRAFDIGEVPSRLPSQRYWQFPYFELPVFQPPHVHIAAGSGIPHLGLDVVLTALLEDLP